MTTIPLTLSSLQAAYEGGIAPSVIIEQVYSRIEEVADPGIFIHLIAKEDVLTAAEKLGPYDPSKPLWGVPFAVKDNIDAAGCPTTAACPAYEYEAAEDAFVVARLKEAGALLIGKTNLDQFATGLVGVRSPYQPPKNAINSDLVPGGSSSGSAVAVAQGVVAFSLGTDTAGSGRIPAGLNNIVGLKPSLGAFSATGVVPACRTLDTISVFALDVPDVYKVFQVAAAYDPEDSYSRMLPKGAMEAAPPVLKIGIPDENSLKFFGDALQEKAFKRDLDLLQAMGAEIIHVDFTPFFDVANMLYEGAWVAERYTTIEDLLKRDPEAIHPVTTAIISKAKEFSSADVFRGFYKLQDLKRAAEPLLSAVDLFCVPTVPRFYSVADLDKDPVTPNSNLGTYTNFVNLMDMCALSVPTDDRGDGLPGGLTLIAGAGKDAYLAGIGANIHQTASCLMGATGWPLLPLDLSPDMSSDADEIELAVCGAHMAGLPLNHQLTDRGGRFVRTAATSADYQFYALAGAPPARPGLVRVGEAQGEEIALEIWSLPKSEVGSFLEGIPSPLGIGTISLQDGNSVKGFLCESWATEQAEDITPLKSWRLYGT